MQALGAGATRHHPDPECTSALVNNLRALETLMPDAQGRHRGDQGPRLWHRSRSCSAGCWKPKTSTGSPWRMPTKALTLREAGIRARILVLNPDPVHLWDHARPWRWNRSWCRPKHVSDGRKQWAEAQRGVSGWPVHLKLDTGMHRLGLGSQRRRHLWKRYLQRSQHWSSSAVMTHLAASRRPPIWTTPPRATGRATSSSARTTNRFQQRAPGTS